MKIHTTVLKVYIELEDIRLLYLMILGIFLWTNIDIYAAV